MKQIRYLIAGSIMLLSLPLLVTVSRTQAQDDTPLPPHVIAVSPYPGEEVPLDQAVTVTFDQPMDRASVESAWQIEPAASGTFTWQDDRTVAFLPDGGWQRATRYTVTLETGAAAANGTTLEAPRDFAVQAIGTLNVTTVIPAPDTTGVTADATITVAFNRPVVPLVATGELDDLPQPLEIEPDIAGRGEWLNTSIYQFTPEKALAGGTTYTVRVKAGLADALGATLDEPYRWTFKTLAPEILNISPRQSEVGVLLDRTINVEFSQAMDHLSTEEAFMLAHNGERVPGEITWSDDSRRLTFTPAEHLQIESVYTISIAPTARSASGEATLESGVTYAFTTVPYPGVADTDPDNNARDVYPGSGVSIYFKSPMNTETFKDKVVIIQPEGVEWQPIASSQRLHLDFATQPETEYVIQFRRGAEDIYGNAIETDYTFSFRTRGVDPWASLPFGDRFMITSAYREHTRIAMSVTAKPVVNLALYSVPVENYALVMRGYRDRSIPLKDPAQLVRAWTQQLDAGPALSGVDEVLLASEQGGKLPPGVYYLEARPETADYTQTLGLGVVTANVTVKRAPGEMLIWVTDIPTGAPVPDATVTFYRADGSTLLAGQTNADGLVRLPVDLSGTSDTFVYAVAQTGDQFGVWMSWSEATPPTQSGYLYTDRPIYRPGETVYFRGAVRDKDDTNYTVPDADSVHVTIDANWGSQRLFEDELPLSEFGTFDGALELPEDAELGEAYIRVELNRRTITEGRFTVAEFRVPEYKVEVTPDFDTVLQGDPVKAAISASYYFGGPVSGAQMTWNAYGTAASFNYTGPGRYDFSDETQAYFSAHYIADASMQTDANGMVLAELEQTTAPSIRPMTITLEGEVVDESGQYISGRASVLAHPANAYVGMRTDRYFGRANTPLTIDLITVTPDSEPLAEQTVTLEVVEIRWERVPLEGQFGRYEWQRNEIEVETDQIATGPDGTAQHDFTPPQAGIYRVRAVTRDQRERVNSSSLQFWVTGETSVWWGRPSNTIDLVADKDGYIPGDTAEILIPTPFTGTSYALVTVERAGIQQVDVFAIEGSTLVYTLPITDQHAPTVHLSVVLVKGTDAETLNPSYRTGQLTLNVEPVARRLEVTVTPSSTRAQPGDTVTLDVKTVDARGEPTRAEVGVTVTDQAILALMPPNSVSLEEHFYGYESNYVRTDVAMSALLDVLTDEILKQARERREAMADDMVAEAPMATGTFAEADADMAAGEMASDGAQQAVTVREDFQQTPLWAPRVVTGVDGEASVTVTLPDNLTTWHVDARGLTENTRVGDSELNIISTLPLLTRPVVPRFFVVGDRATLASVINNNTDQAQTVEARLEASGVTFESEATQTVTIEPGSRARVEWLVTVDDVPNVDLTFYAIGADGYSDAAKPTLATGPDGTIPVYRYTAPDTTGTGGMLREQGARTEAISLPPRLDTDQGELTIRIDPSLAVTTVDALDYLKNYKHQCIEQTVSRFLPNVMTYRALRNLGLDDPALEADLRVVLDEALTRLRNEQNPDGGWGWFGHMESNPYVTAYAALGLIEAQKSGFDIEQGMIDRALNFVRTDFVRPGIDTPVYRLNRQAFYLYVLARGGEANTRELDALLDQRLELDIWAQAFLLMAYHDLNPADPAVAQLVSDLQSTAILSATGGHWEEDALDWWNWSSDTRSTAIALAALTRVQPDNELLPNVVRWLMIARQGDHWETTQETAWAVMALTDWMVSTGELRGNYDYAVTVNGAPLAEGTVTPETVREGKVLAVQVRDLLLDEINRVAVIRGTGDGVLYYTAHLQTRLWASEADPISRGITVSREYFLAGNPDQRITEAQVGDVITVRVTMTLPQDIYYFVLEDPIPAGTEPIDTSLLTTSQLNEPPTIKPQRDPYWYWGWWLFDHTEMRDEQVNLYADFLPRGTYVYTYQVRASFPGEYQTMPSHAYAFYFPEVFGRGAGTLFTVQPAE